MRSDAGRVARPRSPVVGWASPLSAARAVIALVTALVLAQIPASVLAATPGPTGQPVGDPRSSGQGPGLVGDPLTAIVVVVAIGALAVIAALLYVRATGGAPRRSRR